MQLRPYVSDAVHRGQGPSYRSLLAMPPVLYRPAENRRYGWAGRQISPQVRPKLITAGTPTSHRVRAAELGAVGGPTPSLALAALVRYDAVRKTASSASRLRSPHRTPDRQAAHLASRPGTCYPTRDRQADAPLDSLRYIRDVAQWRSGNRCPSGRCGIGASAMPGSVEATGLFYEDRARIIGACPWQKSI